MGLQAAGPAVIVAYVIAGAIVVAVMQMLGELAAAKPDPGTFAAYSRMAFGHWAGFSIGWLYWFMLTMVMGAEMTGAAGFMAGWFGVSPWIPALVCVIFFAVVNLARVGGFGEFEFWFALIKITVILVFLAIGAALIFGLLPGHPAVSTSVISSSGFAPNGISGIAAGLLAVAFVFGGIEIVTIAAAESEDPKTAIGIAIRSVIWRISVFYIGTVLVMSLLIPHSSVSSEKSVAASPFTAVLAMANIPGIVGAMEVVIVLALLSAFNAQIYGTSRLLYSLARRGDAPRVFGEVSHDGVPRAAVLASMFFAFVSVALQYWNPAGLLTFLMNAVGGCLLVIWVMIALSYAKLGFGKVMPAITAVALGALTVLMLTDAASRPQVVSVTVLFAALAALSFPIGRRVALKP